MNIFKKTTTLIANVFTKFWNPKNMVRKISKKCRFTAPFDKQHDKTCSNTVEICTAKPLPYWRMTVNDIESLLKSLLVICKILSLFLNIFTADDKYSLLNRENLMRPIQMKLSHKQKRFSELFSAVLKSSLSFEHFQNKMPLRANVFPRLRTPKNPVR